MTHCLSYFGLPPYVEKALIVMGVIFLLIWLWGLATKRWGEDKVAEVRNFLLGAFIISSLVFGSLGSCSQHRGANYADEVEIGPRGSPW